MIEDGFTDGLISGLRRARGTIRSFQEIILHRVGSGVRGVHSEERREVVALEGVVDLEERRRTRSVDSVEVISSKRMC